MTGRPSGFSDEIADEVCEWLANGGNLIAYCAIEGNPSHSMIYRWLEQQEGFREAYARAREVQAHADAEDINQTADDVKRGVIAPDVGRVVMDAKKWTASKRLPRAYGDKVIVGSDTNAPLIITWANGDKV